MKEKFPVENNTSKIYVWAEVCGIRCVLVEYFPRKQFYVWDEDLLSCAYMKASWWEKRAGIRTLQFLNSGW